MFNNFCDLVDWILYFEFCGVVFWSLWDFVSGFCHLPHTHTYWHARFHYSNYVYAYISMNSLAVLSSYVSSQKYAIMFLIPSWSLRTTMDSNVWKPFYWVGKILKRKSTPVCFPGQRFTPLRGFASLKTCMCIPDFSISFNSSWYQFLSTVYMLHSHDWNCTQLFVFCSQLHQQAN